MEVAAGGEFEPDMPDAGAAAYLLAHLWAAGPTLGENALTHGELQQYQQNAGVQLSPWECTMLRRLSGEYLGESHKAREPNCPAPYVESSDAQRLQQFQLNRDLDTFLD